MVFTETADDLQMLKVTFDYLDTNKNGFVSLAEISKILSDNQNRGSSFSHFADTLQIMKEQLDTDSDGLNFERFKQVMSSVPRVYGHRLQWARSLRFENTLANLLPTGPVFDPLQEIKEMSDHKIREIITEASNEVFRNFVAEKEKLKRADNGFPAEVESTMSKFTGDVGKFGDIGMFEEGLENQIGNPDPYILKGIIRENASEDGFDRLSVNPNYSIVYSPFYEYSRLLGHPSEYNTEKTELKEEDLKGNEDIPIFLLEVAKGLHRDGATGPTLSELQDLKLEFVKLRKSYEQVSKTNEESIGQAMFPGDIGYAHKSMQLKITAENSQTAKKIYSIIAKLSGDSKGCFISAGFPPTPNDKVFTVSVFGAFSFFSTNNADSLQEKLKDLVSGANLQRSDIVYIYCNLEHQGCNESRLKEMLNKFSSTAISQISGLDGVSHEEHVSAIVKKALGPANHSADSAHSGVRIVLVQGRRHFGLRDLMCLPEVKAAKLRVEEAIQAHQYTGPLYQASFI